MSATAHPTGLDGDTLEMVLERARIGRLTRGQHVLLRLGELIAGAEGTASFARRAAAAAAGALPAKASTRFDGAAMAAMARVYARETAMRVATCGIGLVAGATDQTDIDGLGAALRPLPSTRPRRGWPRTWTWWPT